MTPEHNLKIWPRYFEAIADGTKTFEMRSTEDRWFHVGDRLILNEWDPDSESYTGRALERTVTFVLQGPAWGLLPNYAVLALSVGLPAAREDEPVGYPGISSRDVSAASDGGNLENR